MPPTASFWEPVAHRPKFDELGRWKQLAVDLGGLRSPKALMLRAIVEIDRAGGGDCSPRALADRGVPVSESEHARFIDEFVASQYLRHAINRNGEVVGLSVTPYARAAVAQIDAAWTWHRASAFAGM